MKLKTIVLEKSVIIGLFITSFLLVIFFPELVEETVMSLAQASLVFCSLIITLAINPITWLIVALYGIFGHKCK